MHQSLDCQICFLAFDQDERVLKICPCGHTLCLCCLTQHLPLRSNCPFCRLDMHTFENPNHVTTNRALMEILEDKCPFHSELRTLICLTCPSEICSACVFLDERHLHHKIIHRSQICQRKKETKERLWTALDRQTKFRNAIQLLLHHTKKIAMNKLAKLKDIVDKKIEESLIEEIDRFFAEEEEKIEETLERDEDSIQLIREQLATLDNPRIDEEVLEILGKEPLELGAENQHKLLLTDIVHFNQFLDQTIEFTLLLGSIETSQAALDSSLITSSNTAFLNIRRLLSSKTINAKDINKDAPSGNDSQQIIPFKSTQSSREVVRMTNRVLDLLEKQSLALMNSLSQKIDKITPMSLLSLKFWLQGTLVFEIKLCGYQLKYEEMRSLFRNVIPQLTALQDISLNFKEPNLEDGVLQTFEKNTLSSLKKLQVFKVNLDGTRVTNRGITNVLERILETGQNFSVAFGSKKISSKDLAKFIQSALPDEGLITSFEVSILKEDQPECLSIDQLSGQVESTSVVMPILNDESELAIAFGTVFMLERRVSEYVQPSEEGSRCQLITLKLSPQDRTISNSGVSTGNFELQPESARWEKENI